MHSKVLVLYAHPSQNRSEVNRLLFDIASKHHAVTAVDLYAEYPDYHIDIDREQQRLLAHDIVVFLFPVYWYSTPSILKEWQDLVLEHGFAYGSEGDALKEKIFFCAASSGGKESSYQHDGYNHFTMRQLFQPLEQMASLTKMHYLPPFMLFGARTASEEDRLQQHTQLWKKLLDKLPSQPLDIQKLNVLDTLNSWVEQLPEEADHG